MKWRCEENGERKGDGEENKMLIGRDTMRKTRVCLVKRHKKEGRNTERTSEKRKTFTKRNVARVQLSEIEERRDKRRE